MKTKSHIQHVSRKMAAGQLNDDEERLHQIVREELQRNSTSQCISPQTVYARTQQLIRGAANSAIEELAGRPSATRPETSQTTESRSDLTAITAARRSISSLPSVAPKRKAQPGHPWRFKPQKTAKKVETKSGGGKSIYVWLLCATDDDVDVDEYILEDDMVVLKGSVTLEQKDTFAEIKEKITL